MKTPFILTPISASERIAIIDILRGIALCGVLVSNMTGFSSPDIHFSTNLIWTDSVSHVVSFLLDVLVSEKFITIFAILFGIGFAIQMERAATRGSGSLSYYWRRLTVLLLIGLINGVFFWAGDILVTYATFGFLLLLFRNCDQKTIILWALGLHGLMFLLSILTIFHSKQLSIDQASEIKRTIELFGHGTWEAIQHIRFEKFVQIHLYEIPLFLLFIFPRFLFGLWLWRSGFLHNLDTHKSFLQHMCFWGICIGIAGEVVTAVYKMGDMGPLRAFCIPLLAAGYASGIALIAQYGVLKRLCNAFATVGKTSLSNYLFQTAFCTTLFYSYGFGLFGKLGPFSGLVLSTLIYTMEVLISIWWIKRFQLGPVEWILRSITYNRWQNMKRD